MTSRQFIFRGMHLFPNQFIRMLGVERISYKEWYSRIYDYAPSKVRQVSSSVLSQLLTKAPYLLPTFIAR